MLKKKLLFTIFITFLIFSFIGCKKEDINNELTNNNNQDTNIEDIGDEDTSGDSALVEGTKESPQDNNEDEPENKEGEKEEVQEELQEQLNQEKNETESIVTQTPSEEDNTQDNTNPADNLSKENVKDNSDSQDSNESIDMDNIDSDEEPDQNPKPTPTIKPTPKPTLSPTPTPVLASETTSYPYLLLVQNYDETWTAYENKIDDKLMLEVSEITSIMDLNYEDRGSNVFRIKRGRNYAEFKIGRKRVDADYQYNYYEVYAKNAPIKKDGKLYVYYEPLGLLGKLKFYDGSQAKDYKDYEGVVCFSKIHSIEGLPEKYLVYDSEGKPWFPNAKKPTPVPIPTIVPSNVDSKPANYLVLNNGIVRDYFDKPEDGYESYKGLVETVDDYVMINANIFIESLDSSTARFFATNFTYHNIDEKFFSIIVNYNEKDESTLIFERDSTRYKQVFKYSDEVIIHTARIAPYVSKNNGFDFIDPEVLRPLFTKGQYEYKCYHANDTKNYTKKGYGDYEGVLVFDSYVGKATLPKKEQIYRNYDLSNLSKFELDKLPSTMVNGVKIYGTDKFLKPSEQGIGYSDWGYYELDLPELEYMTRKYINERPYLDDMYSSYIAFGHGGTLDAWCIKLMKDSKDEYRLQFSSYYLTGLSNTNNEHEIVGDYDQLARNAREILRAFLYKISSTPELLYDAILESWLGSGEKYNIDAEYVTVGDAKIRFDFDSWEYVITAAD